MSREVQGQPQRCRGIHGGPGESTEVQGRPERCRGSHGGIGASTEVQGHPREVKEVQGYPPRSKGCTEVQLSPRRSRVVY